MWGGVGVKYHCACSGDKPQPAPVGVGGGKWFPHVVLRRRRGSTEWHLKRAPFLRFAFPTGS